jgi:hypothetical protein
METPDKISFKNNLKQFCRQVIEQRIVKAREMIQDAQEAANSEGKSSAGDKYETGRAMGHLQKDMHARQLTEYIKELAGLHGIHTGILYEYACAGAFIETDAASFFIAVGLGKQVVEGRAIFFLSAQAPLAAILQNKKKGDGFIFNGLTLVITNLY